MIWNTSMDIHTSTVAPIVSTAMLCPTNPLAPIPAPAAFFSIGKNTVIIGAMIALDSTGGSMTNGFSSIFEIWSIEVPTPMEMRPETPLSLYPVTASPTMWQQQPITAAPAASPLISSIMARAALDNGAVSVTPNTTATNIPIINGLCSVANPMNSPIPVMKSPIAGPT